MRWYGVEIYRYGRLVRYAKVIASSISEAGYIASRRYSGEVGLIEPLGNMRQAFYRHESKFRKAYNNYKTKHGRGWR